MLPIHERLAQLWVIQKNRALTDIELDEMIKCLEVNANYAYKLARLYNLSGIASMTDDMDWLHSICEDIDILEIQYKTNRPA